MISELMAPVAADLCVPRAGFCIASRTLGNLDRERSGFAGNCYLFIDCGREAAFRMEM